jgi:hypothetical protein
MAVLRTGLSAIPGGPNSSKRWQRSRSVNNQSDRRAPRCVRARLPSRPSSLARDRGSSAHQRDWLCCVLGGRIEATSAVDEGSEFTVTIPVAACPSELLPARGAHSMQHLALRRDSTSHPASGHGAGGPPPLETMAVHVTGRADHDVASSDDRGHSPAATPAPGDGEVQLDSDAEPHPSAGRGSDAYPVIGPTVGASSASPRSISLPTLSQTRAHGRLSKHLSADMDLQADSQSTSGAALRPLVMIGRSHDRGDAARVPFMTETCTSR